VIDLVDRLDDRHSERDIVCAWGTTARQEAVFWMLFGQILETDICPIQVWVELDDTLKERKTHRLAKVQQI